MPKSKCELWNQQFASVYVFKKLSLIWTKWVKNLLSCWVTTQGFLTLEHTHFIKCYKDTSPRSSPSLTDWHVTAGNQTQTSAVDGEHSWKEPFEQLILLLFVTCTMSYFNWFEGENTIVCGWNSLGLTRSLMECGSMSMRVMRGNSTSIRLFWEFFSCNQLVKRQSGYSGSSSPAIN